MTTPVSHHELRELLGPYALDAVDIDEADALDAHLTGCASCRAELRELTEVAGLLGSADTEPPPEIWERISAQLGATAPAPLRALPAPRVTPTRRWAMLAAAAVIVLVAGLASLGVVALHQQHQLDRANRSLTSNGVQQSVDRSALAAAAAPGARQVALVDAHGTTLATVVLVPGATAYLVPTAMRPLDAARTYQLWGMDGTTPISLAVLGSSPATTPIAVPSGVQALAVTEERSPGAVAPTSQPIAQASVA